MLGIVNIDSDWLPWGLGKAPRWFRTIEIARRLGNWSCLEARVVKRFLWAKNVSASDIHSKIVHVYGEEAMNRQHVAK
ncbi:hypothetical protein TNCV_2512061 [Trichonephila clavipes]|nr:hypothetical protein TNCV_2512061 [Trichonephila clavipes]